MNFDATILLSKDIYSLIPYYRRMALINYESRRSLEFRCQIYDFMDGLKK